MPPYSFLQFPDLIHLSPTVSESRHEFSKVMRHSFNSHDLTTINPLSGDDWLLAFSHQICWQLICRSRNVNCLGS